GAGGRLQFQLGQGSTQLTVENHMGSSAVQELNQLSQGIRCLFAVGLGDQADVTEGFARHTRSSDCGECCKDAGLARLLQASGLCGRAAGRLTAQSVASCSFSAAACAFMPPSRTCTSSPALFSRNAAEALRRPVSQQVM